MSNALDIQVDGDHYKKQKMQPIELAYLVGGTPCFTKLAKYITRDKGDRNINLDKAIHCIAIEEEISGKAYDHVAARYPVVSWSSDKGQAFMLIDIFSEDEDIRFALKYMLQRDYTRAIEHVVKFKDRMNGSDQ